MKRTLAFFLLSSSPALAVPHRSPAKPPAKHAAKANLPPAKPAKAAHATVEKKHAATEMKTTATESGKKGAVAKRQTVVNKLPAASDKKVPASDKKTSATDKKFPATDRKLSAPDKKVPASDKKADASDKRPPTPDKKLAASDKKLAASDKKLVATDQMGPPLPPHVQARMLAREHTRATPKAARVPRYPAVTLSLPNLRETFLYRPYDEKGRLRPAATKELEQLLRDHHTGRRHRIDPRLGPAIYQVARHFGRPIEIYSGYRPPEFSTRKHSRHRTGGAIDFHIPGVANEALIHWLRETFHPSGVGYYPNGVHVHLDLDRSEDTYWVDTGDAPTPAPTDANLDESTADESSDVPDVSPAEALVDTNPSVATPPPTGPVIEGAPLPAVALPAASPLLAPASLDDDGFDEPRPTLPSPTAGAPLPLDALDDPGFLP